MSPSIKAQKPIFGVSLKTYKTIKETLSYIDQLRDVFQFCEKQNVDFFVIPDIVTLGRVQLPLPYSAWLGAQDCFWEDHGAYTGTISPANLAELGVKIVEIGHAEQRKIFGETDDIVSKKAIAAIRNGLIPLICVGEITQMEPNKAAEICLRQIQAVTDNVDSDSEIIIAYEPIWAIGQPKPADPQYVIDVIKGIKSQLKSPLRIIYGGSAGPGIYRELSGAVDGLFLGRFGHDISKVYEVVKETM